MPKDNQTTSWEGQAVSRTDSSDLQELLNREKRTRLLTVGLKRVSMELVREPSRVYP